MSKEIGNTGDCNTGSRNTGDYNTGDFNTGYYNTGSRNTGDCNTGYYNTGSRNTGDCNTGDFNTGYYNTGSRNIGSRNTGDRNTGNWNKCNSSTGFFNTVERTITIFNIDSEMTYEEFINSDYFSALTSVNFVLTEWIPYTDAEMKGSVIRKYIGGYLKEYSYTEACKNWWEGMSKRNRNIIMSIPNFDKDIFKEITGIDVTDKKGE